MPDSSTTSPPHGDAADPLVRAFDSLDTALARYAVWPWSGRRRRAVIVALNTVLELHLFAVAHALADTIASLEVRLDRLELERRGDQGEQAREAGG